MTGYCLRSMAGLLLFQLHDRHGFTTALENLHRGGASDIGIWGLESGAWKYSKAARRRMDGMKWMEGKLAEFAANMEAFAHTSYSESWLNMKIRHILLDQSELVDL